MKVKNKIASRSNSMKVIYQRRKKPKLITKFFAFKRKEKKREREIIDAIEFAMISIKSMLNSMLQIQWFQDFK